MRLDSLRRAPRGDATQQLLMRWVQKVFQRFRTARACDPRGKLQWVSHRLEPGVDVFSYLVLLDPITLLDYSL